MKKRINISVDEKVWKKYKKFCIDINDCPSWRIEDFMKRELEYENNEIEELFLNLKEQGFLK